MRLILPVSALLALVLTLVLLQLLWPGLMTWAAPLACPNGYPDAFVAKRVFQLPGETRTSLSMVCMSVHGAMRPGSQFIAMALGFVLLWILFIGLALLYRPLRGRRHPS